MVSIWELIEKRAARIRENTEKKPMLARSISTAGPKLATLTEESDRGKFGFFKG